MPIKTTMIVMNVDLGKKERDTAIERLKGKKNIETVSLIIHLRSQGYTYSHMLENIPRVKELFIEIGDGNRFGVPLASELVRFQDVCDKLEFPSSLTRIEFDGYWMTVRDVQHIGTKVRELRFLETIGFYPRGIEDEVIENICDIVQDMKQLKRVSVCCPSHYVSDSMHISRMLAALPLLEYVRIGCFSRLRENQVDDFMNSLKDARMLKTVEFHTMPDVHWDKVSPETRSIMLRLFDFTLTFPCIEKIALFDRSPKTATRIAHGYRKICILATAGTKQPLSTLYNTLHSFIEQVSSLVMKRLHSTVIGTNKS